MLVGLIGAAATVLAAIIGAWALCKTEKSASSPPSLHPIDTTLVPYRLHRDEMERKEQEVRELLKTVLMHRHQAQLVGEQLARAKRYNDNLTDFFENVSEESKLEIEVAVKPDGRAAVFYNKRLKIELLRAELFIGEQGLIFVAASGSRRPIGLPLPPNVVDPLALNRPDKVLMILMDQATDKALEGFYLPLRIYEPHPTESAQKPTLIDSSAGNA